jgi:hypothetical protein
MEKRIDFENRLFENIYMVKGEKRKINEDE